MVDKDNLQNAVSTVKCKMADFIVERLPADSALSVHGHLYNGVEELKQQCKNPQSVVFCLDKLFSCFDSYDYASEDRYYRNFFFCKNNSEKVDRITSLEEPSAQYCFINKNLPEEALPMVYYSDEDKTMLYAY